MQNAKCKKAGKGAGLVAVAAIALATTSPAGAETTQCTAIASLPYTISAPGTYCLTGDLSTSISDGNAITINANSVTLDLNGHKLAGTAGSSTTVYGVRAVNRKYVVVKNGVIRGFWIGAALAGSNSVANIIEDITGDRNWLAAIEVTGTGCIIRRNLLVNTGGTTAFHQNSDANAIWVHGTGNLIVDNDIKAVNGLGTGTGEGVYALSWNTVIERNRIANVDTGVVAIGTNILVSDNRFMNMPLAISLGGRYRDNLTVGVTTLASGGTDLGGND